MPGCGPARADDQSGARMSEILLNLKVEPLEEGGYLATSPDLNGLVAQGRTVAETMEIAQDVARKLIESYIERGDRLPPKIRSALNRQGRRRATATITVGVSIDTAQTLRFHA